AVGRFKAYSAMGPRGPRGGRWARGSVHGYASAHEGPWDLVLADPPYPLGEAELSEVLSLLSGKLGPGGVVVIERSSRSPEPAWPQGLRRLESSRHGETMLWFAEADDPS
ncbi:MAG: RsmD family RNA methyltransferase, partial [Micrococcales bacterium]|nr:RsmD family RNA methyltransferase [Micrococcales bacterium]